MNERDTGEIEPVFRPLVILFSEGKFDMNNYSELITDDDLFALFYEHTTGKTGGGYLGGYSNFYVGRLKSSPYRVSSFFRQESDQSKFLVIAIFELEDDLEVYENLINNNAERVKVILNTLQKAKKAKQLSLIDDIYKELGNELKFTIFQAERLSKLTKLQKAALIFNSEARLKILEILREKPISKNEIKTIMEKDNININLDILLEPFLDLNLIRRDWIQGTRDPKTGRIKNQGEYLFLIKDLILARVPNQEIANSLKRSNKKLFSLYEQKVIEFFSNYDPLMQTKEESKKLAALLLNPDEYDFINLMRKNYYPKEKLPKVLSDWADINDILKTLSDLNIITEIQDNSDKEWVILLTNIEPLVLFPEFLLSKIKNMLKTTKKEDRKISQELAKKSLSLLELTYEEKIEF